jgi:hypothetical protein
MTIQYGRMASEKVGMSAMNLCHGQEATTLTDVKAERKSTTAVSRKKFSRKSLSTGLLECRSNISGL